MSDAEPWDGWPPDPTSDGWHWVSNGQGPMIVRWSCESMKWKRLGRHAGLPPDAAAAAWRYIGEAVPLPVVA